jgi:hypothetical protein
MNKLNVLDRRQFLSGCAACAAASLCPALTKSAAPETTEAEKTRLRLVFAHPAPERQGWPYQGFDYEARKRELTARLRAACPYAEFLPVWAQNAAEAKKILEADSEVDGYLVYLLGIPGDAGITIAMSGRRTVLVDDLYGGTAQMLGAYPRARKKGLPVAAVSSTRFQDVADAVRAFDTIKKLRASVILDVTERDITALQKSIEEVFGAKVERPPAAELNAAYESADAAEAAKWAGRWIAGARKVVEPTRAELVRSGRMYLAMNSLLKQYKSRTIAVDCLNLFYGGKLPAYPCLGFFQLNNDGWVGACEADLQSAITMLTMGYLVQRPGFISDPVIDTAKNQIVYTHCVAPNRVHGPNSAPNPYLIRSHSEDRKGAAVQSLMPLGEMTSTLKFNPAAREVVFHQGKTVANIDNDRACRTKLAVEIKDPYKMLAGWDRGWHRVTFYGDHRQAVETISALLGIQVVVEG